MGVFCCLNSLFINLLFSQRKNLFRCDDHSKKFQQNSIRKLNIQLTRGLNKWKLKINPPPKNNFLILMM